MTRKYIIVADDSLNGFDEEIAKLEREWGAEEIEPCEDAVSRKEVFQTFGELLGVWGRQALMELPSVTPQQIRWIPCSERLPEKNIEVLVTTKWGCITLGKMLDNNDWLIYEGTTNAIIDDIKAWMPLPEPYKAESEEV